MNRADIKLAIDRCIAHDLEDVANVIEDLSSKYCELERKALLLHSGLKEVLDSIDPTIKYNLKPLDSSWD